MNTESEDNRPMTKSWSSIAAHYDKYPNQETSVIGVASLVKHIQESELSSGLFAWTSMHDLCITQIEVTYPYNGPYLRVRPLFNGQVEFRYVDTSDESRQWHRTEAASEAIPRLQGFLAQLRWFNSAKTR